MTSASLPNLADTTLPSDPAAHISVLTPATQRIFDAAMIPIMVAKIDGTLVYTNEATRAMLGHERTSERLCVWDFVDPRDHEKMRQQLGERRAGKGNDYPIRYRRLDNGRPMLVDVVGTPLTDDDGVPIASLAIARDRTAAALSDAIITRTQRAESWREVLESLGREVGQFLPFDEMTMSLINEQVLMARLLFRCNALIEAQPIARNWYPFGKTALSRLSGGVTVVRNTRAFLNEVKLRRLLNEADASINRGMMSFVAVPILRGARLRAIVAFHSREEAFYSERDAEMLRAVRVNEALQTALFYHTVDEAEFRAGATQEVPEQGSKHGIAKYIVRRLVEHYGWQHVTIFELKTGTSELVPQAQWPTEKARGYLRRRTDQGVLGQCFATGKPVTISQISTPRHKVRVQPLYETSQSVLCYPLQFGSKYRWVLNVEDDRRYVFSNDEISGLRLLIRAVSGAVQSLLDRQIADAVIEGSSQGIIIAGETGKINRMNAEARRILAVSKTGAENRSLESFFDGRPQLFEALMRLPGSTSENEVVLSRDDKGKAPVLLKVEHLHEAFGRRVFFLKDIASLQNIKERQGLEPMLLDLAEQVRVPLSLATAFLRKLTGQSTALPSEQYVDKTSRQLGKIRVAFDRLALWKNDLQNENVRFDLNEKIAECLEELPSRERKMVDGPSKTALKVQGDPFQIKLAIQSILADLLRFCPEEAKLSVFTGRKEGNVEVQISGQIPESAREGDGSNGLMWLNLGLGESVIKRIVKERHHGTYEKRIVGRTAEFRLALPACD